MENQGRSGNYGRGRSRGRGWGRPPYSGHHARGDEPSVVGSSSTNYGGVYREKSPHQSSSTNHQKNLKPKQTQQWRPLSGVKERNPADDVGNVSERSLESMASNSVSDKEHSSSCDQNVSEDLQSGVASLQLGEPIEEGGNGSNPLLYDHCNRFDAAKQLKDKNSSIQLMENNVSDCKESEDPKPSFKSVPFDICPSKEPGVIKLNLSLLIKNREKRNEMKRAKEGNKEIVLRPGMVLLKGGISLEDQVAVVKMCWSLGVGSGGFYQPGYRDGGKLHLKMMCLGKNWDPETSKYGEIRSIDDTKPPSIPVEFDELVEKAMENSYAAVRKDSKTKNPEHLLPWMKPNICIVNFYSENGQLGLHQDRDESRESLDKGLPVVSFSIGDSAEFLFGDKSDPKEAEKVTLESGDILIFGGKSRHVFHGVTAIHPNTAPKALLEETNLRPGRLNLTFRQY